MEESTIINDSDEKNQPNVNELSEETKQNLFKALENQMLIYDKFLKYDWGNCSDWKSYLSNIYPTPTSKEKLMYFRKKFYKFKIDENFDFKFDHHEYYVGEIVRSDSFRKSSDSQKSEVPNKNEKKPKASIINNTPGIMETFFAGFNALLWSLFFFNFLSPVLTSFVSTMACVLTILLDEGFPRFNSDYQSNLKLNDYFQLLLYQIFVLSTDKLNYVLLVPIAFQALIYLSYYSKRYLKICRFIIKYLDFFKRNESFILYLRAYSFVLIGFLLFLGILLNVNQGFIIISHWCFLWFMYNNNYETKQVFSKINTAINRVKSDKNTPRFMIYLLNKLVTWISYIVGSS